jgi:hypothetical protein
LECRRKGFGDFTGSPFDRRLEFISIEPYYINCELPRARCSGRRRVAHISVEVVASAVNGPPWDGLPTSASEFVDAR